MDEASLKNVESPEEVIQRSANPSSKVDNANPELQASVGKHRGSLANLTMTNYTTMLTKEKDQYIEKLRRRNLRAKEKIQELENTNADFWKTIQQQQDILETIEKKLEEQETQFKKEMQFLRSRKNQSIKKLKAFIAKERGEKGKEEEQDSLNPQESDIENELEGLRMDNSRLEEEVERLTNRVDSRTSLTTLPLLQEEDIRRQLEDKEEELGVLREELILAKSVSNSQAGILEGRNELDSELARINLLKEKEVTGNFLSGEMQKRSEVQEELRLVGVELEEVKGEKLQLEALLRDKEQNIDEELHEALQACEKRFREELCVMEEELRKSIEGELRDAKRIAEEKSKEAEETALVCESLSKKLVQERWEGNGMYSNQHGLTDEAESERMKVFRQDHQHSYDNLLKEVAALRRERLWMRDSKMSTISSLSSELERLRKHAALTPVI